MHVHLQTARLAIRRFTVADDDDLVRLNSDPEVMRYITGRPPGREQIRDEIIPFHLAAYGRHPGFGTEGSRALIDKGFTEHDIDRVVAETMTVNLASRRVLEKCGLAHIRTYFDDEPDAIEGADQGFAEYQLTRAQWESATAA